MDKKTKAYIQKYKWIYFQKIMRNESRPNILVIGKALNPKKFYPVNHEKKSSDKNIK